MGPDWVAAVDPDSISPIENPNSPPDGLVPASCFIGTVGGIVSDRLVARPVEGLGANVWDTLLFGGWLCTGREVPLWSIVRCLCIPLGLGADVSEASVTLGFISCFCGGGGSVLNRLLIDPKRFDTPVASLFVGALPGKEAVLPVLLCSLGDV